MRLLFCFCFFFFGEEKVGGGVVYRWWCFTPSCSFLLSLLPWPCFPEQGKAGPTLLFRCSCCHHTHCLLYVFYLFILLLRIKLARYAARAEYECTTTRAYVLYSCTTRVAINAAALCFLMSVIVGDTGRAELSVRR